MIKRYDVRDSQIKFRDGHTISGFGQKAVESPAGDWVKWEDVKHLIPENQIYICSKCKSESNHLKNVDGNDYVMCHSCGEDDFEFESRIKNDKF